MSIITSLIEEINGVQTTNNKALVVLSGGQDSTLCLMLAQLLHGNVEAIHFRYNQRHKKETHYVEKVCEDNGVPLKIVQLPFLRDLVTSNMTNVTGDINSKHPHRPDLPSSFVPVRNALFLTIAHGYAQERGASLLYTGVCQTDYSGYPDCRLEFVQKLQDALNTGYETEIKIITPLMNFTKAETFFIAEQIGCLKTIREDTLTCYEGQDEIIHAWGRGCGKCPSCMLRKKGYNEYYNAYVERIGASQR